MGIKEQLLYELENAPIPLLAEVLDFVQFLKMKRTQPDLREFPKSIDDSMDEMLKEIIVKVIQSKKITDNIDDSMRQVLKKVEIFPEILLEALEEVGLANAITAGRNNDFVSENVIFSILDGDEV